MTEVKVKTEAFKPIELFTNSKAEKELISILEKRIKLTEAVRTEAQIVLKRDLTPLELIKVAEEDISFIKKEIKIGYLFDEASEKFNLQSLGIDYRDLDSAHAELTSWPVPAIVDYDKKSDSFKIDQDERTRVLKQAKTYTSDKYQNDVLSVAKKLVIALNNAQKKGIFSPSIMANFADISKQVITTQYVGNRTKFKVNLNTISRIRSIDNDNDSY